ncbi:MAG: glycosyltransferase [Acidobacteriota bacterium]
MTLERFRDVTHVIGGFLPERLGGTQTQLLQLAIAQRREGYRSDVVTLAQGPGAKSKETRGEYSGVPVTRLGASRSRPWSFESIYMNRELDQPFSDYLAKRQPGCVHFHHLGELSFSLVDVAKQSGFPVVLWLSDFWMQCLRGQRFHPYSMSPCAENSTGRCLECLTALWPSTTPRDLAQWKAAVDKTLVGCDAILVPSAGHQRLLDDWGIEARTTEVVPYGLPRPKIVPSRHDRPVQSIGYIGTLLPSKGAHVLIQAFNQLDRPDLTLDIFGESVRYHEIESYEKALKALPAPGLRVRFHGRYEPSDLARTLAAIDLLVVPSLWWESFCLVAREGARAGLPVVVSALGGLQEAADSGVAVGVPPGDYVALAATLAELIDDPERRLALGCVGRQVCRIEESLQALEEVYRRVVGADQ